MRPVRLCGGPGPDRAWRDGYGALVGGHGPRRDTTTRVTGWRNAPRGTPPPVLDLALGRTHGAKSAPRRALGLALFDSRTPSDLGFCGTPGRIRTCGHRMRSSLVTYRGVSLHTVSCHPIRSTVSSEIVWCRLLSCQYGTAEHERSTNGPVAASDGTSQRSRRTANDLGLCLESSESQGP